MMASDVMVICKKCGGKSPSSVMKLDFDEKLIICPDCVKRKKIHKEVSETSSPKKETAQQATPSRAQINPPSSKIKNTDSGNDALKSMHKCSYCGYKFAINVETKKPKNCPYCNNEVLSFRFV